MGYRNRSQRGKSKARFSMEAKTGITFDDVAGVDEAKEEFQEVMPKLMNGESVNNLECVFVNVKNNNIHYEIKNCLRFKLHTFNSWL